MNETCVICNCVIPEGRQVCPACENPNKIRMQWQQIAFCKWQAKGAAGDFLVWKDGKVWKGRYRNESKQYTFFLPIQKNVKAMKALCEDNHYWED